MKKTYVFLFTMLCIFMPIIAFAAEGTPTVQFDVTQLITGLIGLLATLITGFLLPFIKAKLGLANYERVTMVISTLVEAAEQMFGPKHGEEKIKWVQRQMEARGMAFDRAEVEAAVWQLGQIFTTATEFNESTDE